MSIDFQDGHVISSRGTPIFGDQRPQITSKFVLLHQDSVGVSLISDLDFDNMDIYRIL